MPRCDALVLRLHPDDPDLLEIMLREGDFERRVARAPSSNPRAWEWTTPPSWLRAGAVEALLDKLDEAVQVLDRKIRPSLSANLALVVLLASDERGPLLKRARAAGVAGPLMLAEVPVSTPIGSLARTARQQAAALVTLGARTGEFVQVV